MIPAFDALELIKIFSISGILKQFVKENEMENYCLHPYSYSEFFQAALGGSQGYFKQCQNDYNWEQKMYYSHTALDDYYWLASEYGWRHGLSKKNNPYFTKENEYLSTLLGQDEYSLIWRLIINTKKPHGCGLLIIYTPEYMELDMIELAYNLFMIHHHFAERAKELRQILADEDAAQQEWKEAA